MIDVVSHLIDSITPLLIVLGPGIYVFIGLISFLESTPIIGTFTPGTFIILFCGFMASEGYLDLYPTLIATIVGAALGDMIGYYFGLHGRKYIHDHKGLLRTSHISMGRGFFLKHGGKSVIIGRFTGPIRSIIPVVAGMVGMSLRRFVALNIVGACIWSFIYIYLGYLFGSQLGLVEKVISRTGIVITIICISIGAVVLHIHKRNATKNKFM
jgi:membrane protein DedA with SNARE-associated domain